MRKLVFQHHPGAQVHIQQATDNELQAKLDSLQTQYSQLSELNLNLDLTRGKPGSSQLDLSNALDGILQGDYHAADGSDVRNYGGLDGLPEAKALFGSLLGADPAHTLIGGNSSLTLMYHTLEFAMSEGLAGTASAWGNADTVKFLCPSPGYDRHFSICEHLGIEMISVPMLEDGPDMDIVETLLGEFAVAARDRRVVQGDDVLICPADGDLVVLQVKRLAFVIN